MEGLSEEFAALRTAIGTPCKKTDVENAKRLPLTPNACPPTDTVCYLLIDLTLHLPSLEPELFIYDRTVANPIRLAVGFDHPFLARVE